MEHRQANKMIKALFWMKENVEPLLTRIVNENNLYMRNPITLVSLKDSLLTIYQVRKGSRNRLRLFLLIQITCSSRLMAVPKDELHEGLRNLIRWPLLKISEKSQNQDKGCSLSRVRLLARERNPNQSLKGKNDFS